MKKGRFNLGKKQFISLLALLVVMAAGTAYLYLEYDKVYSTCYLEAGVQVAPEDFFKTDMEELSFSEKGDAVDTNTPGQYQVVIDSKYFTYHSTLIVEDTIAPSAETQEVTIELGGQCSAEDFIAQVSDATAVTVAYESEPNFDQPGKQTVNLLLTDQGDNQTTVVADLVISKVVTELYVEAGSEAPTETDFVTDGDGVEMITDLAAIDYNVPATQTVSLRFDGEQYDIPMIIQDTTAPVVTAQNVNGFVNVVPKVEKFIVSVEDISEVTYSYVKQPDVTGEGTQDVEITVTDASGNSTSVSQKLTLKKDTQAPVISGVADLVAVKGDSISYKKNVTVTDNCEENLQLTVDTSKVDTENVGTYPIEYIAVDAAGNESRASANVTIKAEKYSQEEIDALCDGILAKIFKAGMTDREKARAIFDWIKSHVAYVTHSEHGNINRSTYDAITTGKGDCYTYAAVTQSLLTRAGFKNMMINKIPAKTRHYWNLIDLGDGWYHYDTTPRKDHPDMFMWDDAKLMEYSNSHNLSHNYDRSQYPTIN